MIVNIYLPMSTSPFRLELALSGDVFLLYLYDSCVYLRAPGFLNSVIVSIGFYSIYSISTTGLWFKFGMGMQS
jgi:hypothetical protein